MASATRALPTGPSDAGAVSILWVVCTTVMPALRLPHQCSMTRTILTRITSSVLIPLTAILIEHEPEYLSLELCGGCTLHIRSYQGCHACGSTILSN